MGYGAVFMILNILIVFIKLSGAGLLFITISPKLVFYSGFSSLVYCVLSRFHEIKVDVNLEDIYIYTYWYNIFPQLSGE